MECIFCSLIKSGPIKNILFEDELSVVFPDKYPSNKCHYLIVPKRHIIDINPSSVEEKIIVSHLFDKIVPKVIRRLKLVNYFVTINAGSYQHVPHLHIHLRSDNI